MTHELINVGYVHTEVYTNASLKIELCQMLIIIGLAIKCVHLRPEERDQRTTDMGDDGSSF